MNPLKSWKQFMGDRLLLKSQCECKQDFKCSYDTRLNILVCPNCHNKKVASKGFRTSALAMYVDQCIRIDREEERLKSIENRPKESSFESCIKAIGESLNGTEYKSVVDICRSWARYEENLALHPDTFRTVLWENIFHLTRKGYRDANYVERFSIGQESLEALLKRVVEADKTGVLELPEGKLIKRADNAPGLRYFDGRCIKNEEHWTWNHFIETADRPDEHANYVQEQTKATWMEALLASSSKNQAEEVYGAQEKAWRASREKALDAALREGMELGKVEERIVQQAKRVLEHAHKVIELCPTTILECCKQDDCKCEERVLPEGCSEEVATQQFEAAKDELKSAIEALAQAPTKPKRTVKRKGKAVEVQK